MDKSWYFYLIRSQLLFVRHWKIVRLICCGCYGLVEEYSATCMELVELGETEPRLLMAPWETAGVGQSRGGGRGDREGEKNGIESCEWVASSEKTKLPLAEDETAWRHRETIPCKRFPRA